MRTKISPPRARLRGTGKKDPEEGPGKRTRKKVRKKEPKKERALQTSADLVSNLRIFELRHPEVRAEERQRCAPAVDLGAEPPLALGAPPVSRFRGFRGGRPGRGTYVKIKC